MKIMDRIWALCKGVSLTGWVMSALIIANTIAVRYRFVNYSESEGMLFGTGQDLDYYQFFRKEILAYGALFLMLIFLYRILRRQIDWSDKKNLIPIGVLWISVMISFGLSPYKDLAMKGLAGHYEGLSTMISYLTVATVLGIIGIRRKDLPILYGSFALSLLFVTGVSLVQMTGVDPKDWTIIKWYSTIQYIAPNQPRYNFQAGSSHAFFSNPNFLGSYYALLMPFLGFGFLNCSKKIYRAFLWMLLVLSYLALFGAQSLAGILAVPIGMVMLIVLHRKSAIQERLVYHSAWLCAAIIASYWFMDQPYQRDVLMASGFYCIIVLVGEGFLVNWISLRQVGIVTAASVIIGITVFIFVLKDRPVSQEAFIDVEDGVIHTVFDGTSYRISIQGDNAVISSDDGDDWVMTDIGKLLKTDSVSVPLYFDKLKRGKSEILLLQPFGIRFSKSEAGFHYLNLSYQIDDIDRPPTIGPQGYETLGSGRMYIWQRTIPMIIEHPLFGHGPDSFAVDFPQNEPLLKQRIYHTPYIVVNKSHNLYLTHAVSYGLIGLACFLIFQVELLRLLNKAVVDERLKAFSVPTLAGFSSYLIIGLANDSRVYIGIYYWILVGLTLTLTRHQDVTERIG